MMVTRVGCEVGKPVPWANARVGTPHAKVRRADRIMLAIGRTLVGGPANLPRNQPFVESYHQKNSQLPGQFMMPLMPVAAAILALQAASSPPPPPAPNARTAMARRAAPPPPIDGQDNDDAWRLARVIKDLRQVPPACAAVP